MDCMIIWKHFWSGSLEALYEKAFFITAFYVVATLGAEFY